MIVSTVSELDERQRAWIIEQLNARGTKHPCPRCGNSQFNLLDSLVSIGQNIGFGGGAAIPAVVCFCTRCGFIAPHALGVLGELPPPMRGTR